MPDTASIFTQLQFVDSVLINPTIKNTLLTVTTTFDDLGIETTGQVQAGGNIIGIDGLFAGAVTVSNGINTASLGNDTLTVANVTTTGSVSCGTASMTPGLFTGNLKFVSAIVDDNSLQVLTSQQAAIADSTGTEADNMRAINDVLTMLRAHGLIAT